MTGNKRQKGYSLLEIIVVLGIFSLLTMAIINVYLLALRSQRQTVSRQQALGSLRYVAETIAQNIRTGEIDYPAYEGSLSVPENKLYLVDQNGQKVEYFLQTSGGQGQIQVSVDGQAYALTNLSDINVVKMAFYINPLFSPFLEERCNDSLPSNGCLPTNPLSCTVNDPNLTVKSGFCQCSANSDCATKNCAADAAGDKICLPPNAQPRVTISLGFETVAARAAEKKLIYLQTTVSSRVYKR